MLITILYHSLKFRAVIRLGGKGAVNVIAYNVDFGTACKLHTLTELTFDRFFALIVARIASVNNCFHDFYLLATL